ncbi:MAG TPA: dihydrodipicolinate synthase family protein [Dehalococcoidia bacterium]|nr:dihydrodipicolinate synthase family protein [Dehalococcoidia bacterium]
MLGPSDLKGVYAIMATPAKEGADQLDARDTVDLDEAARATDQLIKDGVGGLIVLGTTGECATLLEDEYCAFVDCFLSTVNKRVPTFVGTTALGSRAVAERIKFVSERGADGTLLGLPMWQPLTVPMAVEYYASLAEAFPDFAIMVYANANAFRFNFPPPFWRQAVDRAPTIIAAKYGDVGAYLPSLAASKGRVNFLPVDGVAYAYARLSPETMTACWSTASSMGPQPTLALMKALREEDWQKAKEIADDLRWASETFSPPGGQPEFASYNIQLEKTRFDAAGYMKAGPIRQPYNVIPDAYAEGARECGRRWAELVKKYAPVTA